MPERPDLEYWVPLLDAALGQRTITAVDVKLPVVLRVAVPGDPASLLVGRRIEGVLRKGPFVRFPLDGGLEVDVHPMLAGRFTIAPAGSRGHRDLAVTWTLDDGNELRYRDDVEMGKVYVVRDPDAQVPGFATIGLDALDPAVFTREAFGKLAKKRRDQVKAFLMDHSAIDTFGNAYADETLWEARIHPKARVSELKPDQLDALYAAIGNVLTRARDEIARRKPPLDEKLRDFLAVRGRKGESCPRCGTTIRTCGMHGHDAFFCPTCQPDAKGRGFVDWGKLKK